MNKILPIGLLLVVPVSAAASGSEVLSLFWLSILVFVIVAGSLFLAKIKLKEKFVIFFVYFAAVSVVFMATSNMPYLNNMYFINTVIPLLAWLTIYVYYIKKEKT